MDYNETFIPIGGIHVLNFTIGILYETPYI